MYIKFWSEILKRKDHLREKDVGGRIISKLNLKKWDVRTWIGFSLLRSATEDGLCFRELVI